MYFTLLVSLHFNLFYFNLLKASDYTWKWAIDQWFLFFYFFMFTSNEWRTVQWLINMSMFNVYESCNGCFSISHQHKPFFTCGFSPHSGSTPLKAIAFPLNTNLSWFNHYIFRYNSFSCFYPRSTCLTIPWPMQMLIASAAVTRPVPTDMKIDITKSMRHSPVCQSLIPD